MKSINILSFLLLSFFPFVAFCRSFTSQNPIVLPTTTHNNNNDLPPEVLDMDGLPLYIGEKYIIHNPLIGGGSVYLANLRPFGCPNTVLQHVPIPGLMGKGTPVKFILKDDNDDVVRETDAIDIMFSTVDSSSPCFNETIWKVDDKDQCVVTGGNESNLFKIMKHEVPQLENVYKIMYCPDASAQLMCKDVSLTIHNGLHRLVAAAKNPLPIVFVKE